MWAGLTELCHVKIPQDDNLRVTPLSRAAIYRRLSDGEGDISLQGAGEGQSGNVTVWASLCESHNLSAL